MEPAGGDAIALNTGVPSGPALFSELQPIADAPAIKISEKIRQQKSRMHTPP
jgi:hypothetical protein